MLKIENKKQKFIAYFEGEVSIYNVAEYAKEIVPILDGLNELVINLINVSEIDSAGVQLLMMLKKECMVRSKKLTLVDHSDVVLDVFELMGLVTYFNDPVVLPKEKD
jgi:anti-sigma B factor antagonist